MKISTIFCGMLLCLAPGAALAAEPDAQACPATASQFETDRFYAQRAADILRAGAAKDQILLAKLVAPTASYDIQSGDTFMGNPKRGVDAIIALTQFMRLTRYQGQSPFHGPIVIVHLACTWDVTLLFPSSAGELSMKMTFSFEQGLLTKVRGNSVQLFEGDAR
jgi:hypothetical protein